MTLDTSSFICLCFLALATSGCPPAPSSRPFEPSTARGRELYSKARRDVFPQDFRGKAPDANAPLVAWVGKVVNRDVLHDPERGNALRVVLEHHYFDFIEDRGLHRAKYFVSPRGEGNFGFIDATPENVANDRYVPIGGMVIIVGKPREVAPDGTVVLDLAWTIQLPPGTFATDFWDYGRDYLLHGDKADFKSLRTF